MTKYYLATVQDRHSDLENHLFSTAAKALAFVEKVLDEESLRRNYPIRNATAMNKNQLKAARLIFFQLYSLEGDYVQVQELTLDEGAA